MSEQTYELILRKSMWQWLFTDEMGEVLSDEGRSKETLDQEPRVEWRSEC